MELNSLLFPAYHLQNNYGPLQDLLKIRNMGTNDNGDNQDGQESSFIRDHLIFNAFQNELIFIPRLDSSQNKIPCLLLTHAMSLKLLIYLHGNGEDLLLCQPQLQEMRSRLEVNILAIEYPEYDKFYMSFLLGHEAPSNPTVSVDQVLKDILHVYTFLRQKIHIKN